MSDDHEEPAAGKRVAVDLLDGIGVVRLDRPEKLNALSVPMLKEVGRVLDELGRGGNSKGIVLTGEGRAFSAGDDLPATESLTLADFEELLSAFQALTLRILQADVPVLAALNGIAVGGAAEMTLACDARVGHPGSD
ncbi:MAG: enoyl-CoA hydratase/isomerase family protein, partial [Actinomycetota bacterium]|nr:enoyl-CoA hydratase/isomerase family protein [Actinomycetota bacterium]